MSYETAPDFIVTLKGERVHFGQEFEFFGKTTKLVGAFIDENGYSKVVIEPEIWTNGAFNVVPNPYIGMPATVHIGSDSYATSVVEITYFKEGKRAGEVKTIVTGHRDLEFRLNKWGRYRAQESFGLGLGYARDYRDPHF